MSDVSCRPVLDLLDHLESGGRSVEAFLARYRERLGPVDAARPEVTSAWMRQARARIPWRHWVVFVDLWCETVGPDAERDWARRSVETGRARWTQIFPYALRLITSPAQLYWLSNRASAQSFPNVRATMATLADGRLQLEFSLRPEDEPSIATFRVTGYMLAGLPRLIGLPAAIVEAELAPTRALYRITLPPSFTLWARMMRHFKAFLAVRSLVRELGGKEDATQERYARLREAHAELEEKVRQRTLALERQVAALHEAERIAHLGSWEWTFAQDVLVLSEECRRILGLDEGGTLPSKEELKSTVLPEDLERARLTALKAFSGEAPFDLEVRIMHRESGLRHVHARAVIHRDPAGRPQRFVGTAHDVTLRKTYEQSIVQAMLAADAANRTKSAFLANVSHEIRTPMTAVLGFTDLLHDPRCTAEKRGEYVERIQRNGRHLLALIDDLLDLSRIEAGRLVVQLSAFPPAQELMQTVESLRGQADDRGLSLSLEIEDGLPGELLSDQLRFRQILLNVIGNALKFTDVGGVTVRAAVLETAGATMLEVAVQDSGVGIPTALQARLFQPFSQAKSPHEAGRGGTGLGLTLARDLARALGGDLTLDASEEGEGSTFVLRVAMPPVGAEIHAAARAPIAVAENAKTLLPAGAQIFLVEDNPDIRELVQWLLREAGATVSTASSAEEALPRILCEKVDLVLMDMGLGALDGFHATRLLRQRGYRRPIVARRPSPPRPSARAASPRAATTTFRSRSTGTPSSASRRSGSAARRFDANARPGSAHLSCGTVYKPYRTGRPRPRLQADKPLILLVFLAS